MRVAMQMWRRKLGWVSCDRRAHHTWRDHWMQARPHALHGYAFRTASSWAGVWRSPTGVVLCIGDRELSSVTFRWELATRPAGRYLEIEGGSSSFAIPAPEAHPPDDDITWDAIDRDLEDFWGYVARLGADPRVRSAFEAGFEVPD